MSRKKSEKRGKSRRSNQRRKGNLVIILILLLVVAIAFGYWHLRGSGDTPLTSCAMCASEEAVSATDAVSSGDVSGADIATEDVSDRELAASDADVSGADVSASDTAQSEDTGFFGKVGEFFAKIGRWFGNLFSKIGGWFGDTFASCGASSVGREVTSSDASDSDEEPVSDEVQMWEVQGDDAQYMSLLRGKTDEFIDYFTRLGEMEKELSEYGSAASIRRDKDYTTLERRLTGWCEAALLYPRDALFGEDARAACQLSYDLAMATTHYLSVYPEIVAGEYKSISGETPDDLLNAVGDAVVALYAKVNGLDTAPPEDAVSASDAGDAAVQG